MRPSARASHRISSATPPSLPGRAPPDDKASFSAMSSARLTSTCSPAIAWGSSRCEVARRSRGRAARRCRRRDGWRTSRGCWTIPTWRVSGQGGRDDGHAVVAGLSADDSRLGPGPSGYRPTTTSLICVTGARSLQWAMSATISFLSWWAIKHDLPGLRRRRRCSLEKASIVRRRTAAFACKRPTPERAGPARAFPGRTK